MMPVMTKTLVSLYYPVKARLLFVRVGIKVYVVIPAIKMKRVGITLMY